MKTKKISFMRSFLNNVSLEKECNINTRIKDNL
jgi:hypothetical protein